MGGSNESAGRSGVTERTVSSMDFVNSTAWKALGAVLFLACLIVTAYCWYDADQEAKGAGRYAENSKR